MIRVLTRMNRVINLSKVIYNERRRDEKSPIREREGEREGEEKGQKKGMGTAAFRGGGQGGDRSTMEAAEKYTRS